MNLLFGEKKLLSTQLYHETQTYDGGWDVFRRYITAGIYAPRISGENPSS